MKFSQQSWVEVERGNGAEISIFLNYHLRREETSALVNFFSSHLFFFRNGEFNLPHFFLFYSMEVQEARGCGRRQPFSGGWPQNRKEILAKF